MWCMVRLEHKRFTAAGRKHGASKPNETARAISGGSLIMKENFGSHFERRYLTLKLGKGEGK